MTFSSDKLLALIRIEHTTYEDEIIVWRYIHSLYPYNKKSSFCKNHYKCLFYRFFLSFSSDTNYTIKDDNVEDIVLCGRSRWKIENEHNNTLKTKGYHLEHNYGHGKNLSFVLITLNLLAFLFHTVLELVDEKYIIIRKKLSSRHSFFDDIRALTRYIFFESWNQLMDFMLGGFKTTINSS